MSLENAKVLYKELKELGLEAKAADVARGYPEISKIKDDPIPKEESGKKEAKKDGKKPKR